MTALGNEIFAAAFLGLALTLTFLMFYLWKFPYDKHRHVSTAPRSLVMLHRLLGYAFVAIYLYLMVDMVPRLWTYQVELPARTVAHLLLGMAIGGILIVKIAVVRFFKHMEATLVPMLGTALLICTVLLLGLALPTTFREAFLRGQALMGGNMSTEHLARVREQLPKAGIVDPAAIEELSSEASLYDGRSVLVSKCVQCHDLRTILVRPRTPETWRRTVERMANRSTVLNPINADEQLKVTAYLIAISPTLQQSTYLRRQETMKSAQAQQALESSMQSMGDGEPLGPAFDLAAATATFEARCSQCHATVLVQANPPASMEAAEMLVRRMVTNGLEASEEELSQVIGYLTATYAKPAESPDQATGAPADETALASAAVDEPEQSNPLATGQIDAEIVVRPAGTELRFESPELTVKTGARIRIALDNPSASGITHNFVLVRDPNAFDEVSNVALGAPDAGFVPTHEQVITAIPAQGPGSRATVDLEAPPPGRYRYGCMMPGHSLTMQGTLIVTE